MKCRAEEEEQKQKQKRAGEQCNVAFHGHALVLRSKHERERESSCAAKPLGFYAVGERVRKRVMGYKKERERE